MSNTPNRMESELIRNSALYLNATTRERSWVWEQVQKGRFPKVVAEVLRSFGDVSQIAPHLIEPHVTNAIRPFKQNAPNGDISERF